MLQKARFRLRKGNVRLGRLTRRSEAAQGEGPRPAREDRGQGEALVGGSKQTARKKANQSGLARFKPTLSKRIRKALHKKKVRHQGQGHGVPARRTAEQRHADEKADALRPRRWAGSTTRRGGGGSRALYDRSLKATEEAGLRETRRRALAAASGPDDRPRRRHRRQSRSLPGGGHGARPRRARPAHAEEAARESRREAGWGRASSRRRPKTLPFPDSSFDTAVFTLVLCTVPDPRRGAGRGGAGAAAGRQAAVRRARALAASPGWPAGRTGSKSPGASSATAATATATRSPRSPGARR